MKKIFLILLLVSGLMKAQDVTTTMGNTTTSFRDTLTTTIDSIKVNGIGGGFAYTITAYTTTGTDTVNVYTTPKGYTVWSQKGLKDMSTGGTVSNIIVSTTPKEYVIFDHDLVSMLLVTPDASASCVITVSKKYGQISLAPSLSSVETSLDNIEADADSTVDMVTDIDNNTDGLEAKLDSIDASSTRNETKLDDANTKLDSIDASSTRIEGKVDAVKDTISAGNATATAIRNILASDSLTVKDIANLKNYLNQIYTKLNSDSLTVIDAANIKNELTLIYNKLNSDSLTVKDVLGIEQNQINGSQRTLLVDGSNDIIGVATSPLFVKPDYAYIKVTDTWGAAADTSEYDFANVYLKGYITIYDSSATADTLVLEVYSYAKLGWTSQMIGFRDIVTDYLESDNTTVIIAGTTAKKFEINKLRPGRVRVRPKTPGTTWQTKRVIFEGVN